MGLCQEAMEGLDILGKEIQEELSAIYQQRSINANNMDEIDQSEDKSNSVELEKNKSNNIQNQTKQL